MKPIPRGMSRAGFAVQILLLLLSGIAGLDIVDAVTSKSPFDVLDISFPSGEAVKDFVTVHNSGMTAAFVQKGGMNGNMASNQSGRQTNAASLETMAMSMAAMGNALADTPELAAGMNAIEKIVNETLAELFSKYWHDVGQEPLLYQRWLNSTAACAAALHKGNLPTMDQKHLECRIQQSQISTMLDSATTCSVEYHTALAKLRREACDYFWNTVDAFPRTELPHQCMKEPDEMNDHYLARVVNDFNNRRMAWNYSFTKCQDRIDEFANSTEYCANLTQGLADKTAECDALQMQLDAASCNIIMGKEDVATTVCEDYTKCWNYATKTYITENASIAKTEVEMAGEIMSLKRVRCICLALQLPEGDIEQGLSDCADMTFNMADCYSSPAAPDGYQCSGVGPPINYSYYLEDWNPPHTPTLPPVPTNCETQAIALKPCTRQYVEAYFSKLPANAPSAPSTVPCCTMCNYFGGCGTNLMRPYASLIKGFDEDTCCLEVNWVIGPWSPPNHGEECPTGCGHPAQYYTRAISCQNQLGAPAEEAECVKHIGEKGSTGLECAATESCITCDPCDWGYERRGCVAETGYYGKCVACQKFRGFHFVEKGSCEQKQCELCTNTGEYRAKCEYAFGTLGHCASCTEKPGTYFVAPGAFEDSSCPTKNCTKCKNGEFSFSCAGTFPGVCKSCQGADNSGIHGYQQFYTGPGAVANDPYSCPLRLCNYDSCKFGSYLVNCGGSNPGTCVPCQPVCSFFTDQAACPPSCHWNTEMSVCEATTWVVDVKGSKCRMVPCSSSICGKGNYLAGCGGIMNGTCRPCHTLPQDRFHLNPGRYSPDCPSVACQNCSIGMYRANCSGISGGACVQCSQPPFGRYLSGHGGTTDNCPSEPCDGEVCGAGHYLYQCGGMVKGHCKSCTALAGGFYFSSNGNITDSCDQTACNVSRCEIGFYLRNCGGHMSPAQPGACKPCSAPPEFYYHNSNGGIANDCKTSRCSDLPACPNGQYRAGCGGKDNPNSQGECTWCINIAPGIVYFAEPGNATGWCEERSCDTLPNCDDGLMRGGCGIPSNPVSQGFCNVSCPSPGDGWYYYEGCVSQPCGGCGSSQYRVGCGTNELHTSPGQCSNCPDPPPGMFFDLSMVTGCDPQNCSEMPSCGLGMFRKGCGLRHQGFCTACETPAHAYYHVGRGYLSAGSCHLASCNELDPCAAGQYRKDCGAAHDPQSIGHCAPCDLPPFGNYYDAPSDDAGNATSCPMKSCHDVSTCPPGWFRSGCGESEELNYNTVGSCVKCSSPPDGYYYIADGGLVDDCAKLSCANTPQCDIGWFRYDCGGPDTPTTLGSCVPCSPPIAGRFFISHGYRNDSCAEELCSTAAECNAGEYRTNCGGQNNPVSSGFCKQCSAPLLPGNIWLTDGDFFDDCSQGPPPTTTSTTWR